MYKTLFTIISTITFFMGTLFVTPPVIASNLENLAQSLAKIRAEVEALQEQLDLEKEKHGSRIAALSTQLADLSVEERRQKMAIEKLQHAIKKISEHSRKAEISGKKLKPVLLKTLAIYQRHVQQGLPFKVADRVQAIQELKKNLVNDLIDPNRAVNQLWSLFEDEIRLSKENGIYQQTILLDGENILADVAKIGTVFLFFQTKDSRTGMAKKFPDSGWKFVTADAAKDNQRIAKLFDSLKKQIRQGYFELPNPWKL